MNPKRDLAPRRPDYRPGSPPEEFIVPLLKDRIEAAILGDITPGKSRVVLDVGCGRQPFRGMLEELDCRYVGMDVAQTPEKSVHIIAAIDGPLPPILTAEGPFDYILCTEVLEHVADWTTAFANLASLLRSGGRILITCPHFFRLHEEPYDFWRPTLHAITHYATANGFTVTRQEAAGDGWDVLGTLLASCVATPHPKQKAARLKAKFVNAARRFALALLKLRLPQRLAKFPGSYLSNIVLLEKG